MLPGVLFVSFFCLSSSSPISNALKKCNAQQEDLDDCLMYNLNVIVPSLKSGWEWMDLPGLDPVKFPQKLTPYYHDGNMTLDVIISNSVVTGLSETKVVVVRKRAKSRPQCNFGSKTGFPSCREKGPSAEAGEDHQCSQPQITYVWRRSKTFSIGKLEVMTFTPRITFKGGYTSEGYTGIFPLQSSGHFNITFNDVNTAWVAYLSKTNISGVNYLTVDSMKLDAMPTNIFIDGAHTFDGSNEIAVDMITSLNANSIELYDLLKPRLMRFMKHELQLYINTLLATAPINDLVAGLNLQDWKKKR